VARSDWHNSDGHESLLRWEAAISPLWGLNPRPYAYEAHAQPTELRRPLASLLLMPLSQIVTGAQRVRFCICFVDHYPENSNPDEIMY
jgi:hypothetical protein